MIETPTYTVGELARRIGYALEAAFPDDVWVTGEISGINRSRGGHVYFDIVEIAADPDQAPLAAMAVSLFKMNKEVVNRLLKRAGISRIENGMQVRIRGVVSFWERTGRLQLRMTSIDPTYTLGQLAADRDRVRKQLTAEGIVDRNSRLILPLVPLEIGLVTSAGSAAYHDFVTELERSGYAWRVHLVDTRVQGVGADVEVEQAIRVLAAQGVALIALVRGGGSRLDLAAFDTERVARAIAMLDVPVLTGVGHEIDRSIADDVAHTAYKTPTACAVGIVSQVATYLERADRAYAAAAVAARRTLDRHERHVQSTAEHCARATRGALAMHAVRIDHLVERIGREADHLLVRHRSRIDRAEGRLTADASRHLRGAESLVAAAVEQLQQRPDRLLAAAERRLDTLAAQSRAHDPARTLARGWSITRDAHGAVLRSARDAVPGAALRTTLADGTVHSTIAIAEPTTDED